MPENLQNNEEPHYDGHLPLLPPYPDTSQSQHRFLPLIERSSGNNPASGGVSVHAVQLMIPSATAMFTNTANNTFTFGAQPVLPSAAVSATTFMNTNHVVSPTPVHPSAATNIFNVPSTFITQPVIPPVPVHPVANDIAPSAPQATAPITPAIFANLANNTASPVPQEMAPITLAHAAPLKNTTNVLTTFVGQPVILPTSVYSAAEMKAAKDATPLISQPIMPIVTTEPVSLNHQESPSTHSTSSEIPSAAQLLIHHELPASSKATFTDTGIVVPSVATPPVEREKRKRKAVDKGVVPLTEHKGQLVDWLISAHQNLSDADIVDSSWIALIIDWYKLETESGATDTS